MAVKECLKPGVQLVEKKYDVLESNRKGVTSGMIKHLKQRHHITDKPTLHASKDMNSLRLSVAATIMNLTRGVETNATG